MRSGLPAKVQLLLATGVVFQVVAWLSCLHLRHKWRFSFGSSVLLLYLTGLGWLGLGQWVSNTDDWYLYLAQAVLLVVSLITFGLHVLMDSGALERRYAQQLADRLAGRKDWPSDLSSCRTLPEVKAFRDALHLDASPAIGMLTHSRPQVRVAALAALEFRKHWRPGQPQAIFRAAQRASEPPIRAAAVMALANVDDRVLIEQLAEYLRDPTWEVRRAAQEALLWDTGTRWAWIRHAIRQCLSEADQAEDGPLFPSGQLLTYEAIADLKAWAAEKGMLALRSAQTLGLHYGRALNEQPEPGLIEELQQQLADDHTPAPLRLELANMLQTHNLLTRELQEKLINPANSASLRLIAAEGLLEMGGHAGAIAALRDVARLPNREIALATANIVQRRLGIDLGLRPDQPVPAIHSRQAADVTRRVMMWAAQNATQYPAPNQHAEAAHGSNVIRH
jgi:hypothetical protein